MMIEGAIHFGNAAQIAKEGEQLIKELTESIIIDLDKFSYADSSAMAVFIEWSRFANKNSKQLKLVNTPKFFSDLCTANGLEQILLGKG